MTAPTPPRPRQVTLAAWLIMLGSVFVVLTVFERISGLQTLETQENVSRFLSEPPGDGLGLGVQGALDILRTLAMVAGGCAAAAAILGYQVLQRSRAARLALTVLALPLFVTGMAAGGFMSSVVAAAAVMLWFQPARDWFDGVTREATSSRDGSRRDPDVEKPDVAADPAPTPGPTEPRAFPGFGSTPSSPAAGPTTGPIGGPFVGQVPVATATPTGAAAPRPSAVTWACALTWVFAALTVVVMATSMVVLAANPDLVLDEVRRQNPELGQGVSADLVVRVTYVLGAVVIAWSLLAVVLAALTFRRVRWARIALVGSASLAAALCLVATVGQFLMLVPLSACIATLALLVRPDIRAWFD